MFDYFSEQIYNIWVMFRLKSVFETTALLNLQYFPLTFARSNRVTDDAFRAEIRLSMAHNLSFL